MASLTTFQASVSGPKRGGEEGDVVGDGAFGGGAVEGVEPGGEALVPEEVGSRVRRSFCSWARGDVGVYADQGFGRGSATCACQLTLGRKDRRWRQ